MDKTLRSFLGLFGLLVSLCACQPAPTQEVDHWQRIGEFQDRRLTDSLLPYLATGAPAQHRYWAALALASVQDTLAVPELARLLTKDPDARVRQAAAYALGQTGQVATNPLLIYAFQTENESQPVRAAVLEALGKCADSSAVDFLASLSLPGPDLAALRHGQVLGLYRALLVQPKPLALPAGVERVIGYLDRGYPDSLRLIAAQYLARNPQKSYEAHVPALMKWMINDPQPLVRAHLAMALAGAKNPEVVGHLKSLLAEDPADEVRIGALRGLEAFEMADIQAEVAKALGHPNPNVAVAAAELIRRKALASDRALYLGWAQACPHPRARALVLGAAIRLEQGEEATLLADQWYRQTNSPYEKGFLLRAMAENPRNLGRIAARFVPEQPMLLNTFALEALVQVRAHEGFAKLGEPAAQQLADLLKRAIGSRDAGLVALAAGTLRNTQYDYKTRLADAGFLAQAKAALVLPKEQETLIELQKTIDYFAGRAEVATQAPAHNHPIDWALVASLPPNLRAVVETSKGPIEFQLLVRQAPGSVANFVKLVREGFYSAKSFHRVVPNFVAQGGCPRGDGYGSTDYTIRSEFAPLRYGVGSVGLASAGKDTESCQWFITYLPTPHLDGRYTIFAQVTKGLDVVARLEIGDEIKRIRLEE
jgi:cyclophilin family peptidyl-prolyl cis-trans isomerase/HEAT repeat protein